MDRFDAALFRMSPAEAAATDPQQRILLEDTHAALHDARATLDADISSFTGAIDTRASFVYLVSSLCLQEKVKNCRGIHLHSLMRKAESTMD